jgi:hypothetical protein
MTFSLKKSAGGFVSTRRFFLVIMLLLAGTGAGCTDRPAGVPTVLSDQIFL